MRRVRIVFGLAVAVCAFGALTGSAFAKEKLVFGEFVASVGGKTISPSEPAPVTENKEDEAELTGLQLGQYKFGVVNKSTGTIETEEPCLKSPKVTGEVTAERSSSLLTDIGFRQCVTSDVEGGIISYKTNNFKLAIRFVSNESAEIGKTAEDGIEIAEKADLVIKGGAQKCLVEVPAQFVPGNAGSNPEKSWEAAEYTPEEEEIENWEKSKKLKEEYPVDVKKRLEIETTEKFKGIVSFVDTDGTEKKGCTPKKGEENGKLITEKEIEGKPNPHYLWTEYRSGRIFMNAEGLEIKGGELTFEPPAA
jgi:hypothetical protein